jgi:glycine/D-amino acid oxidase-like deaminating enzyme
MIEILNPLEIYIEGKDNRADFTLGDDPTENFEHVADVDFILSKYGDGIGYRLPGIADLQVTSVISGIRSISIDSLPIIGPIDCLVGYYNDCGWGGNGVSLSPIGGKIIAEFITGSDNLPLDKGLFLLERFK